MPLKATVKETAIPAPLQNVCKYDGNFPNNVLGGLGYRSLCVTSSNPSQAGSDSKLLINPAVKCEHNTYI